MRVDTTSVRGFEVDRARLMRSCHQGQVLKVTYHNKPYVVIAPAVGWSVLPDDELAKLESARDELDALREELAQLRSTRGADSVAA